MAETLVTMDSDIAARIYVVRNRKVMLDSDLAEIYGVTTSRLNEQFRRNRSRFPVDFAFELTYQEFTILMSQIATSKRTRGGRRKPPVAFTEHGAVMLATVLNSATAIQASIHVVRAFVYLRELVSTRAEIETKLTQIQGRLDQHDEALQKLLEAIRQLLKGLCDEPRRQIGFHVKNEAKQHVSSKSRNLTHAQHTRYTPADQVG